VTNMKWREHLQMSPRIRQDTGGDIYNQGARVLASKHKPLDSTKIDLFFDKNGLAALSFVYWLYPNQVFLMPTVAQDARFQNQIITLQQYMAGKRSNVSIYIGDEASFEQNKSLLGKNEKVEIILKRDDQIVARIQKQ